MREMAPAAARRRGVDGAAVLRQGFAELIREREVLQGRREGLCQGKGCDSPPTPPLFIGEGERGPVMKPCI